jgi:hypothetical protein
VLAYQIDAAGCTCLRVSQGRYRPRGVRPPWFLEAYPP